MVKEECNPFAGKWKIDAIRPGDDGKFNRLPMACDDVLTIDVQETGLVTFERTCSDGKPDPAWAGVRGVYSAQTGEIVGQILKDGRGDLKTEFLIKTDEGNRILGRHRHNPNDGEWGGGTAG